MSGLHPDGQREERMGGLSTSRFLPVLSTTTQASPTSSKSGPPRSLPSPKASSSRRGSTQNTWSREIAKTISAWVASSSVLTSGLPSPFGVEDAAQCNARNQVRREPAPEVVGDPSAILLASVQRQVVTVGSVQVYPPLRRTTLPGPARHDLTRDILGIFGV
jgi:hypothetical protein